MAMWASGIELENEARQAAKDEADGVKRFKLNPAALKRRLAKKKAAQKAAHE